MTWLSRLFRRRRFASGGAIPVLQRRGDEIPVFISPGRSTRRRPGESWAEGMNRLTEGRDL